MHALALIGPYGAGKTTLLRAALETLAARGEGPVAVLQNELGKETLDVTSGPVASLVGGCLCCTAPDRLGSALADLERGQPRHLLIEAPAVAAPDALRALLAGALATLEAVTVVAVFDGARAGNPEAFFIRPFTRTLVRGAEIVAFTRSSAWDAAQQAAWTAAVANLNPKASLAFGDSQALGQRLAGALLPAG